MGKRSLKLVSPVCFTFQRMWGYDEIGFCWDGMGSLIIGGMYDSAFISPCIC